MHRFTVDVGWTNRRPIRPDEHVSRVTVLAESGAEAERVAVSMVGARCEMVTSSVVTDWEEGAP